MALVALDTNIIRDILQNVPEPLWLEPLFGLRHEHRFAIAEIAVVELYSQLLHSAIPWDVWASKRSRITSLLNASSPVVLGKEDLSLARRAARKAAYVSHFRSVPTSAFWHRMLEATSPLDLAAEFSSTDALGHPISASPSRERLDAILAEARDRWIGFVTDTSDLYGMMDARLRDVGLPPLTPAQRADISRASFKAAYTTDDPHLAEYLEISIHLMRLAARRRGYNPASHANDGLDINMLIALRSAEILLTSERRFIRLIREAVRPQGKSRVFHPEDFIRGAV